MVVTPAVAVHFETTTTMTAAVGLVVVGPAAVEGLHSDRRIPSSPRRRTLMSIHKRRRKIKPH